MKIIIVGGTGTIGQAIEKELSKRHRIVIVGHKSGELQVDIENKQSIENMYKTVGNFDAVIATTGQAPFVSLSKITTELYEIGLKNKLMGQVNLVLIGMKYINDAGSFTLTGGITNQDPIISGSPSAMVNGALEGFTKSVAIEMPRNIGINLISPTILTESMDKYGDSFRGFFPVPASQVALAYSKSVEGGAQTGQIYRVGYSI